MTEQQIAQNVELVRNLVEKLPEPRKSLVQKMLDGPVGSSYFTSPASSREDFHNCFVGGLCQHSLNVVANLKKISKALCPDRFSDATIIFVGLFHDLGKVGDGTEEFYVPNPNEWGRKRGFLYVLNPNCVYMPTAERGLYILQKHGIELTSDEYLAIRLNDGMYDETNKKYAMHEPDLALLVHMADRWSCSLEKSQDLKPKT